MKGYIVNIFGFGDHTASVTILQLCHFSTDRALEYVNEWVWPCSNKTSFAIAGGSGLDGPFAHPDLRCSENLQPGKSVSWPSKPESQCLPASPLRNPPLREEGPRPALKFTLCLWETGGLDLWPCRFVSHNSVRNYTNFYQQPLGKWSGPFP